MAAAAQAAMYSHADGMDDGAFGAMEPIEPSGAHSMGYSLQDAGLDGTHLDSHVLNARPKARLSEEERLALQVTKRREQELERRQRIFDAKRRTIGLDLEALEAQRAENRQRRQAEVAEARAGDLELLRTNQQLQVLEMQKQRERKEMERHCKEHSLQTLNFESRREFDINDPHANRKGLPARVGDLDPRCGPASMQKFNGEDLTQQERKRQQQQAMINFVEQQKFEKAMMNSGAKEEALAHAQDVAEITAIRNELEADEANLRRELNRSQQDENLQRAADNAAQRRLLAQLEQERNARELDFHANDAFLQEKAQPSLPDGRIRRDAYKGATRSERTQVAEHQLDQADMNYARKRHEQMEDHLFARQTEMTRKQMIAMEREKSRMRRAAAEQVARANRQEGSEKHLNRIDLSKNEIRPEFFEQFGTSCR